MCQRGEFHVKDVHIHPTKGGEGGGVCVCVCVGGGGRGCLKSLAVLQKVGIKLNWNFQWGVDGGIKLKKIH